MAITTQRHVAGNSAFATSHNLSVQVDAGTDRGLLVAIDSRGGGITSPTGVTYNSVSMTSIGGTSTAMSWWYLAAPATGTNTLTSTFASSTGVRMMAWVLNGVHQTNAPAYLAGTNASPISWSWTGRTVGDFIAAVGSRQGTPTWVAGGGLAEDSDATYIFNATTATAGVGAGSMIADATSETPTQAFTGGDGGPNLLGSAAWGDAAGVTPPAFQTSLNSFETFDMPIIIPKNTATAALRRIPFVLVDATTLAPIDITVTGVKPDLSFGGGTDAASTNDIVKVDGPKGMYYLELTQTEANNAYGPVHGHLTPSGCATSYLAAVIGPASAYSEASTTTDIANAVVEAEIDALETYNRTTNTAATITGPINGATTLTITTDAAYEPIKSIS